MVYRLVLSLHGGENRSFFRLVCFNLSLHGGENRSFVCLVCFNLHDFVGLIWFFIGLLWCSILSIFFICWGMIFSTGFNLPSTCFDCSVFIPSNATPSNSLLPFVKGYLAGWLLSGTCRTSFHPICAREASHRMEVWAKYGCDNVSLNYSLSKIRPV